MQNDFNRIHFIDFIDKTTSNFLLVIFVNIMDVFAPNSIWVEWLISWLLVKVNIQKFVPQKDSFSGDELRKPICRENFLSKCTESHDFSIPLLHNVGFPCIFWATNDPLICSPFLAQKFLLSKLSHNPLFVRMHSKGPF